MAEATTEAPAAEGTTTRQARSQEKLQEACEAVEKLLKGKEWVPSAEIHAKLKDTMSEGMFGRVKAVLGIEHRRTKSDSTGKPEYQWRLPAKSKSSSS